MNTLFGVEIMAQAKIDTMNKAKEKGCACPVCGQLVKVYKRSINHAMALQLATAHRKFGVYTVFHRREITETFESGGGDFAKLRYWGLIAEIESDNPKKKNSGKWIVTAAGRAFLQSIKRIPKYALIYNGRFLEFEGTETVTFRECLGEDFDYENLMEA